MQENAPESFKSFDTTAGTSTRSDTEKMMESMESTAEKVSDRYAAARDKLKEHWAVAKDDLDNLKQKAFDYSQTAARATNTFAHDHPWTTAGAAVGVGALIGWLVTRRSDSPRSSR